MGFALFFLAEYGSIILMSVLTVIMFLGGWIIIPNFFIFQPFILGFKTCFILFFLSELELHFHAIVLIN
jgi:NADH:ubiquinone oxidoreductase subunit H